MPRIFCNQAMKIYCPKRIWPRKLCHLCGQPFKRDGSWIQHYHVSEMHKIPPARKIKAFLKSLKGSEDLPNTTF